MMAQKAFKPVIIVINKWDAAEGQPDPKGRPATTARYEEYIRAELKGLSFAPISFMSAKTGRNVKRTIDLAFDLREQSAQRVTTGKLNRLIRAIMETRGPTDTKGTFAKVFYVAQTGAEPPTITMVVNNPELFRPNYLRFLMNRFREELPFPEVPIRIVVRARRQREDDLAQEGGDVKVRRGRKGVGERLGARSSKPVNPPPDPDLGDAWLSDENSQSIDNPGDDASKYFDA
jgi:GTP-binding protein